MTATKNFPTLYKKTSTGKIQQWSVYVSESNGHGLITLMFGQVGGKIQTNQETISEGKNIGRSNETTPVEQAIAQAKSDWDKQKKKGYVESITDAMNEVVDIDVIAGGVSPMLAHKFHEQGHKITWPAYVQPKLDGHRCIAIINNGHCTLWSRTRKPILSAPHIVRELEERFPGYMLVLDGELYNHAYHDNFEKLSSRIRQSKPVAGYEEIQYWIYDKVSDESFSQRFASLQQLIKRNTEHIRLLHTFTVADEAEMMWRFEKSREKNFEGVMVRDPGSPYLNKRSYGLQKVKEFDDAEFPLVDVVEGTGTMAGKGIFELAMPDGTLFRAKMVGNMEKLREYLEHKDQYIGKLVTVKYQGTTGAKKVPRFPVAMRFHVDV